MKIILIRHGESLSNVTQTFSGSVDVALSELGELQAQKVCEYLCNNYKFDKVYSSPLMRAYSTVKGVADKQGLEIITDDRLREICGGDFENMKLADIVVKYPKEFYMWKNNIGLFVCPNGESFADVQKRGMSVLTEIAQNNPNKTVAIGVHAGIIRTMICKIKGLSLEQMQQVPWAKNASIYELEFNDGKFTLLKEDFCDYLDGMVTEFKDSV